MAKLLSLKTLTIIMFVIAFFPSFFGYYPYPTWLEMTFYIVFGLLFLALIVQMLKNKDENDQESNEMK